MTDERLNELDRLAEAATPPPWRYLIVTMGHPDNRKNPVVDAANGTTVARLFSQEATVAGMVSRAPTGAVADANAALIAAAREAVPALVAEVRRLQAALAATTVEARP